MSEKVKLSEMASVSGIGGLHKILGRTRVGLLIESLNETKKKQSVPLNNKVSVLSEIAMFAISEDRRLGLIFENIHQLVNSEGLQIPTKEASAQELKAFMEKVMPDYDKERVLVSHIQKLANWYHQAKDYLDWEDLSQSNKEEKTDNQEPEVHAPSEEKKFVE